MFSVELEQAAAQAADWLLQHHSPEQAKIAGPFVAQLFTALSHGHSFIWLNDEQAALLAAQTDLVGQDGNTPLVLIGKRLFLGRLWQLERDLAQEIKRLAHSEISVANEQQTAANLAAWFPDTDSKGQRDAAALALLQTFMLIIGGPGTGKTTTVAKLLGLICCNAATLPKIALAAPTGKAAAHMARALHSALSRFDLPPAVAQHLAQLEGQTVHRLLKLRPPQMQPQFDRRTPLPVDVLVVDEASMLDVSLLLQLLRALPEGCRVIFLGDADQLPSVGVGAVLAALSQPTVLNQETAQKLSRYLPDFAFPVADNPPPLSANIARLSFSHRFGENSGIGCVARAVVAGDTAASWAQFARFPNELAAVSGDVRTQVEQFYRKQEAFWQAVDSNHLPQAFSRIADIVMLTAWRQDAETFNQAYTEYLRQRRRIEGDGTWFAGRIIMITRNHYSLDLFNGDIGLVLPDSEDTENLAAYFPDGDGFKKIAISRLPDCESAFAMTVHKSQGSEYREVWLLPPSSEAAESEDITSGLNNALLYTAITRAREHFVFWGGQPAWNESVGKIKKRQTALDYFIRRQFNGEAV
ncbi:exodeoxyribonuclease V subunit alpha [Neisseria lisongii]|uniref:RecBCD enzyme subunit RecD n=1 Tax=Neisseria lisongii TaxID=2912188 RepID=A0AAW5AJI3_9NEIS|nr:exodeoxyribonuclease V subunit alpha [Neisseria lisongii]MCF7530023.1 exodeoxyribonuclease V subunit alpha [Neisseria lisongii]